MRHLSTFAALVALGAIAGSQQLEAAETADYAYIGTYTRDAPGGAGEAQSEGIYVAIVTDTGSFRFSNTTPRTHLIAADLLQRGADPERLYRHVFASVPLRRIHLLRAALERLEVDLELPIVSVSIPWNLIA
jgi:nanoRNase/pAp phosphatase (c-di-AMP/oligoRNAs hydrolase)